MIKYKIAANRIEHLFEFMNFFKLNEIIKHKYIQEMNGERIVHVLVFELALITSRTFLSKVHKFKSVFGDVIFIEKRDSVRFTD